MKDGGVSWNQSPVSKQGVQTRFKCSICMRQYKMEHARDTHQKKCEEFHNAHKVD